MLNFKHLHRLILAMCVIVIPLATPSFAHELPSVNIPTSYGSTHTITTFDETYTAKTDHDLKLLTARFELSLLIYEKDAIQKGLDRDRSGLRDAAKGVGIPLLAGKKPGLAGIIVLVDKISDLLDEGKHFEIYLEFIDKWVEIDAQNNKIAGAYSDRDKFYEEYAKRWRHKYENDNPPNPVPPKNDLDDLSTMQQNIPPIGVRCGGACNDWWHNREYTLSDIGNAEWTALGIPLIRDPITRVIGTEAPLNMLAEYATIHQACCLGCSDTYWTCRPRDVDKHEVKYCKIKITYRPGIVGMKVLGVCGKPYRKCDDPATKADHVYVPYYSFTTDYRGRYVYWVSGIRGYKSNCGGGDTTAPPVSVYGPNGVGFINDPDQTPNCDMCYDGSPNCPQAATHH